MSSKKINILYLGIFLGLTCAVSAVIMGIAADVTKKPISDAKKANLMEKLRQVIQDFDGEPVLKTVQTEDNIPVEFYLVEKNGKFAGAAGISSSMKGYAGKVQVMAGLDAGGKIKTVIVTEHNETPGLGTKITDRIRQKTVFNLFSAAAPGLPANKILDQFNGHSVSGDDSWKAPWKVKKDGGDIDFITGATVTTRAITDAVYRIESAWMQNKDTLVPE
ncbi:MAG: RnfABCDGE type electron transport complex subunit G [Victivallales bacterium]|jgi:electron transport complex protein RnfG